MSDKYDGILGLAFHEIAQSKSTTTILDVLNPVEFMIDLERCEILIYICLLILNYYLFINFSIY